MPSWENKKSQRGRQQADKVVFPFLGGKKKKKKKRMFAAIFNSIISFIIFIFYYFFGLLGPLPRDM